MLEALIWDVDGTLAETERDGHRVAFNRAFVECGLPWHWGVPEYGRLLRVAGGFERLLAYMDERQDAPPDPVVRERLARSIHACKNHHFALLVEQGGLGPRPGVRRLIEQCLGQGIVLAVATTTSRGNVEALFPHLFGAQWRDLFRAVVCAEDAPRKKPDPLVYNLVLERLGRTCAEVLAMEDSPAGLAAARAAGVACLITRSRYFAAADFAGAAWVCSDLDAPVSVSGLTSARVDVAALRAIHARHRERDSGRAKEGGQGPEKERPR
ncbi:MAG: HAD-IA family hydrolase [Rhodanobacter sp.]|jgi:HAD superfamily hydrolase (TIGR01509 family)|nr:HAD-IA family hydrolase [Rhodanobacter sp.]